jgi:hypothetical protein
MRWFELRRDELLYYRNSRSKAPRGRFVLTRECSTRVVSDADARRVGAPNNPRTTARAAAKEDEGNASDGDDVPDASRRAHGCPPKPLCFALQSPAGELYVQADSESSLAGWLEALDTVLGLLRLQHSPRMPRSRPLSVRAPKSVAMRSNGDGTMPASASGEQRVPDRAGRVRQSAENAPAVSNTPDPAEDHDAPVQGHAPHFAGRPLVPCRCCVQCEATFRNRRQLL